MNFFFSPKLLSPLNADKRRAEEHLYFLSLNGSAFLLSVVLLFILLYFLSVILLCRLCSDSTFPLGFFSIVRMPSAVAKAAAIVVT